jgi:beta-lactamase superfamily II metal-dependent hydrolase
MISIEVLPAAHGDSIWIEYGSPPQVHRILIDGGPAHTYESGLRRRIAALQGAECKLDLMVITHIDADHIDGALILLQELTQLNVHINELWFNGWPQLLQKGDARASYAPLQGEFLGALIMVDPVLEGIWNQEFDHQAVVIPDNDDIPLPEIELEGNARLILLGPSMRDLRRLRARWVSALRDFSPGDTEEALRRLRERRQYRAPATPAVFAPPQYGNDRSPANGSSISFVFERDDVSVLFAGDARARTLAESLERLAEQRSVNKVRFDVVKLPHHGSMRNVSDAWLQWVDCEQWLISTNGDVFDHPDVETAQLIARHCHPETPTMLCNYRSPSTELLEVLGGTDQWTTAFPEGETVGPVGGLKLSW